MEEKSKVQEFAENEMCKEAANESIAEPADSCKCHSGNFKLQKRHKYRFMFACFMLLLQIVTVCLLVNIRCHMKHRMRRFGNFRPPIHRFEEDSLRRGQRGDFKSSVREESADEEEPEHKQRPEMEHEGASDMHDQADPDRQAM